MMSDEDDDGYGTEYGSYDGPTSESARNYEHGDEEEEEDDRQYEMSGDDFFDSTLQNLSTRRIQMSYMNEFQDYVEGLVYREYLEVERRIARYMQNDAHHSVHVVYNAASIQPNSTKVLRPQNIELYNNERERHYFYELLWRDDFDSAFISPRTSPYALGPDAMPTGESGLPVIRPPRWNEQHYVPRTMYCEYVDVSEAVPQSLNFFVQDNESPVYLSPKPSLFLKTFTMMGIQPRATTTSSSSAAWSRLTPELITEVLHFSHHDPSHNEYPRIITDMSPPPIPVERPNRIHDYDETSLLEYFPN